MGVAVKRFLSTLSVWFFLLGADAFSWDRAALDPATPDSLAERVRQLEAETAALRAELQASRDGGLPQAGVPVSASMTDTVATAEEGFMSLDELRGEMKKLVWTKGDYKIVPYGSLWGSAIYDTRRTSPGAYAFFVLSPDRQGEDQFIVDTRRTRLGIDITGPQIPLFHCANSRGRVEIDFTGEFVTENRAAVLLRHAYAEVYDDDFRLLAGQTSDLISPLIPHTVSYSVGWGGGNIGYRRMQIRYERHLSFSDQLQVTPAVAVCQNIIFDVAAGIGRESTNWPIVEGRLGFTLGPRGTGEKPITFGVSAHVGEQGFDFPAVGPLPAIDDARVTTWSFNADLVVPITDRMSFQAELFLGDDLSTFLGGSLEGVDFTTREAIYSAGGWCELGFDWTPSVHSYVGYSVDDPRNSDLVYTPARDLRTYNQFLFANVIYDVTQKLKLGAEVTWWKTHWLGLAPGDAVRFEFAGQYEF